MVQLIQKHSIVVLVLNVIILMAKHVGMQKMVQLVPNVHQLTGNAKYNVFKIQCELKEFASFFY
jgi:hypothetical protein